MIIGISGLEGSGKTTIGKLIAKKLNLRFISVGNIQRNIAKAKGITLKELQNIESKNPKTDYLIELIQKYEINKGNLVLDSRLSSMFDCDFKIFLGASDSERYKRIRKAKRDFNYDILERTKNNIERFKNYYHFNYNDKNKYDLIIDTTNMSIKEVVDIILYFLDLKKYLS